MICIIVRVARIIGKPPATFESTVNCLLFFLRGGWTLTILPKS
jgi:hypothetical protein